MNFKHVSFGMLALLAITACGDDSTPATSDTDTDTDTGSESGSNTNPMTSVTSADTSSTGVTTLDGSSSESESGDTTPPDSSSSSEDSGPPPMAAEFEVSITNVSDVSVLPSTLGAGLWIEQELGSEPVFTPDMPDRGDGLVALAADGDPSELDDAIMAVPEAVQWGTWDMALAPGEQTSFTFTADPGDRLSLLAGLGAGNDHFVGTGSLGVALFANNGQPMDMRDISDVLRIWEVGTEYTQAPGQGFDQLSTQAAAGDGMPESGAVTAFNSSTRALPQAAQVVHVDLATDAKNPATLIITIDNLGGTVASDLSQMVWALHEDTVSVFAAGGQASAVDGLEALAEDGDGSVLLTTLMGTAGVGSAELIDTPAAPGESFVITVTPDEDNRMLSFVTSIAASNDAFVAAGPGGIALLDDDGSARTNAQIEEDFRRLLVVWDAGTESNEVPGAGNNTQDEQLLDDSGTPDADDTIRPYSSSVNDLAGAGAGGTITATVEDGDNPGELDITFENTSGGTPYPAALSPVLWAVHDDSVTLFDADMPASPSLEILAEDADASALLGDLMGLAGVVETDVDVMPLGTGASFTITVSPDAASSRLSIAAMVIPSNDTFIALGGGGVALVDDGGDPLSAAALETAINAALGAWESGTEANQAGAAGRDQVPRQADDNTGANEGNGQVRSSEDDLIWAWPDANQIVLITVAPTGN
jgi:Spondin_N